MADDIIEQIRPHIQEVLRIVLDNQGRTLHELNELVGQTSKFQSQFFFNSYAKAVMVQPLHVSLDNEGQSSEPIHIDFKRLRRSGRACSTKRTYENMQCATSTSSGQLKKHKYTVDEASTIGDLNKSSNRDEPISNQASIVPASTETCSDNPTMSSDRTSEASSILKPLEAAVPTPATRTQMESSAIVAVLPEADILPMTHVDGLAILDEYFEQPVVSAGPADDSSLANHSAISGASSNRGTANEVTADLNASTSGPLLQAVEKAAVPETFNESTTPELTAASAAMSEFGLKNGPSLAGSMFTHPTSTTSSAAHTNNNLLASDLKHSTLIKRAVLDESAQWLEAVSMALETVVDVSRKPRNSVLEHMDLVLTEMEFEQCVKIMTAIAENVVKCTRCLAKPELDVGQEQSPELGRNKTTSNGRGLITGITLQRLNQSQFPHDICHGKRARIQVELQRLLSEPDELMGSFQEDGDYETALKQIEKDNADDTRNRLRQSWKETFYWPMIQQRAKMIGLLPKSSGRKTDITPQEKSAAKKLILALGYGQSRDNVFKWTLYWKLLSELRDKGATTILLYRTHEFKAYFFQHPKQLDTLLSWNRIYELPLRQLGARIIAEEEDDFSGKSDIEEKWIFDRLHAPQNIHWRDDLSIWDGESMECKNFIADHNIPPTSTKSNTHLLRSGLCGQPDSNKSRFISLMPYEGESGRRTLGSCASSTGLLAVVPLIPIIRGDFLGIFPGRLRYTSQQPPRSIPGPVANLWLEHSVITGKLGRMRVAKADETTNVCLAWESVNEVKGEKTSCQYLRILVIATRHIIPFDELVRPSVAK